MRASVESGGRSLSQYSQFGRSCSAMGVSHVEARRSFANQTLEANDESPSISDMREPAKEKTILSFRDAPLGADPESILPVVSWIPGLRSFRSRPGMMVGFLPRRLPLAGQLGNIRLGRIADRRGRARKAWRRGGLRDAVAGDKNLARRVMRMIRRLAHGQDRRKADVGTLHDGAPLVARLGLEHVHQFLLERRPCFGVHLLIEAGLRKTGMLPQQRVELRLDRADRNELATRAFIDAVEMRAAVE